MIKHCNFKHSHYYKIIYQRGPSKLPFTEYLVCRSCFDSGMPWNNPAGIISKRVVAPDKPKNEE